MNFLEILSPLFRKKNLLFFCFLFLFTIFMGVFLNLSKVQKSTIYFTIKSPKIENMSLNPIGSSAEIADAISGWVKNPGFRNQILDTAELKIPKFKKKIFARQQNRLNVFWTIQLKDEEISFAEKLVKATIKILNQNIYQLNKENGFPIQISTPTIDHEIREFPISWMIIAAVFGSVFLSVLFIYLLENFTGKISFLDEIKNIFPGSSLLQISKKLGEHDEKLFEKFIFNISKKNNQNLQPKFIATFQTDNFFELSSIEDIDQEKDLPILLIKLGATTRQELENLYAIFGKKLGLIVFVV